MVPLRFRHYPINVLESDRNFPVPRKTHFRDWFARDSPLQRRESANFRFRETDDVKSIEIVDIEPALGVQ